MPALARAMASARPSREPSPGARVRGGERFRERRASRAEFEAEDDARTHARTRGEEPGEARKDLESVRLASLAPIGALPDASGRDRGATRVCAAAVWRSAPAAKPIAEQAAIVRATRAIVTPRERRRSTWHRRALFRFAMMRTFAIRARRFPPSRRARVETEICNTATPPVAHCPLARDALARAFARSLARVASRTRAPPRLASASRARRALGASTCPPLGRVDNPRSARSAFSDAPRSGDDGTRRS